MTDTFSIEVDRETIEIMERYALENGWSSLDDYLTDVIGRDVEKAIQSSWQTFIDELVNELVHGKDCGCTPPMGIL